MKMAFDAIQKSDKKERFVFGIDGLSRSGKTTLANTVANQAKEMGMAVCLFHIDDFIVERKKRYGTGSAEWWEYYELQWPVDILAETFFSKLKTAKQVELAFYDSDLDECQTKRIQFPQQGLILIEGVFLQRREWRCYFDKMLYLACPRENRLLREAKEVRENLGKMERRYWKAESYYEETVQPETLADWVLECTAEGQEKR